MRGFCSLCVSDEFTSADRTEDGRRFFSCSNPEHGAEPWVWEPSEDRPKRHRGDGLGSELDIWDKLLACLQPGEDFIPYGDIEDRFIERFPTETGQLLSRYGHRWRYPAHPASKYSMSAYLAARLKDLEREGHLALRFDRAEGSWAYNEIISWWKVA